MSSSFSSSTSTSQSPSEYTSSAASFDKDLLFPKGYPSPISPYPRSNHVKIQDTINTHKISPNFTPFFPDDYPKPLSPYPKPSGCLFKSLSPESGNEETGNPSSPRYSRHHHQKPTSLKTASKLKEAGFSFSSSSLSPSLSESQTQYQSEDKLGKEGDEYYAEYDNIAAKPIDIPLEKQKKSARYRDWVANGFPFAVKGGLPANDAPVVRVRGERKKERVVRFVVEKVKEKDEKGEEDDGWEDHEDEDSEPPVLSAESLEELSESIIAKKEKSEQAVALVDARVVHFIVLLKERVITGVRRLEMDVEDCITVYTSMFKKIFGKKGLPVSIWGKIKGRFDSVVLEECIRGILKERGLSEAEPFNDGKESCKVVVCAKAFELTTTVLLRSYDADDALNNIPATICEAVRATSAATSFFDPVTIGPRGRKFVDGALGANNPVEQLWNEAQAIWCRDKEVELTALLKCFVSIGTGNPGRKAVAEGSLKFFSETLVRIATQTEDIAKIFVERHRRLYESRRYFRFNVQQGLQGVGLEEYKAAALIDAATAEYMDGQEIKSAAQECAVNLKHKHFPIKFSSKDIIDWRNSQLRSNYDKPKAITFMPFLRNEGLINRNDIFKTLDQLITPQSHNRSAAIWGLGGCGKTQIALEYAYRYQDQSSCSIFWVHADSEARFTQDYSEIAKIAGLSADLKGQDLLRAVQKWIEQQTNWLLVLDNADDLKIFKKTHTTSQGRSLQNPELLKFIPKAQSGTVIWTSRDGGILGSIVDIQRGVEVGAMTDREAWDLFQRLCGRSHGNEPSRDEEKLLRLLEFLPLAIAQAAAYIRTRKVPAQQYLRLFNESKTRQLNLLSQEFQDVFRSEVPNSVMRTWHISMKQIAEEYPCSERILNIIAFLDNKGLPFELLQAIVGPQFDEDEVLLAASRLMEYSFLQIQRVVNEGMPTYEQHRLVQLAARQALTEVQTHLLSGEALRIMEKLFPNGTYETWNLCRLYLPHALEAAAWRDTEEYKDKGLSLLEHISRFYWEQGRSDEAEKLEVEVLDQRKEVLGPKHPDTIMAMANLALTWRQQGRFDEAEKLQVEVLDLRKEVLGPKHPDTILAIANLV
ncbi:hypothetical protein G7Y89_g15154 [Cudoniella acicularis]|uniref:PNPLA domain-containing protein n=1 Tax=Cudoniella acicularis TaxID=354080 RepID=A0A8H4QTU0_9HELO|nr:hypothetical protein G7Y89_g15154 [Cudoniella acicularis]